jgi:hypothetical protein
LQNVNKRFHIETNKNYNNILIGYNDDNIQYYNNNNENIDNTTLVKINEYKNKNKIKNNNKIFDKLNYDNYYYFGPFTGIFE